MDRIEGRIREFFEQNYQLLRLEGGHALTEDVKEKALNQVLLYWRKLKELAQKVTDSEVRLSLPNQTTPEGRTFSIEGVVDIVEEGDEIRMYDIKTHDLEYIHGNKEFYEEQLNVYAHVWQGLRKNKLDFTAVISTSFPKCIAECLKKNDEESLNKHIDEWEPVIPIDMSEDKVQSTIRSFGEVIDNIENSRFECMPVESLTEKVPGTNQSVVTKVCANCDGRFSCASYRENARTATKGKIKEFVKYFESSIDRDEQEDWLAGNSNFENEEDNI